MSARLHDAAPMTFGLAPRHVAPCGCAETYPQLMSVMAHGPGCGLAFPTADEILSKHPRTWSDAEREYIQRAYRRGGLSGGLHNVLSDVLWQERAAREGQAIARRIFEARSTGPTLALTEDELAAYVAAGIELFGCRHAQPAGDAAERQLQNDLGTED